MYVLFDMMLKFMSIMVRVGMCFPNRRGEEREE
jgi:hypothetical protein